jgi:hypothetical protein
VTWTVLPALYWPKTPRGWTLMAYEKRGKMVCRYFPPKPSPTPPDPGHERS